MKKKFALLATILVCLAGLGAGLYFYFNSMEDTSFNAVEQQWLEKNKNDVVDFYMPSGIAGFTYMGKGIFFDFINSLSEKTGLTFNPIAYRGEIEVENVSYAIELVDKPNENQRVVLKDNYVILTIENLTYTSISRIDNLKLGVMSGDEKKARQYLTGANIEFVVYEDEEEFEQALLGEEPVVDGVIVLKSLYLDKMLNHELHIAYHIQDMTKSYVLTINGKEPILNDIFNKHYTTWSKEHLEDSYNENLLEVYFEFKGITEKERTSLREKAYIYAYANNGAYDFTKSGKLRGINVHIIKAFAEFANVDVEYLTEFSSLNDLVQAFNKGEVDFLFGNNAVEYTIDHVMTSSPIKGEVVILSNVKNNQPVESIYSLVGKKVKVVKDSKIERYFNANGIKTTSYDSLDELLNKANKNSIIAIDLENYEFYKLNELANFKIDYLFSLDEDYNYIINSNNKVFAELFDFYIEYISVQNLISDSYKTLYVSSNSLIYMWIIIVGLSLIIFIQFLYHTNRLISFFKKRRKNILSKNEKLKYIDVLTSLKNRAYLNDNIERWDSSEVYPQVIVVIDLNNIAYINDNFGHDEGDKIITEAANILIQNQMPKTDIMRTDGNEFLIYMVQYDEKQAVAYIRRLAKEFKELTHGFGAAIGYSIINDEIKTIDDAVNEATLDMRTNKEAMHEE